MVKHIQTRVGDVLVLLTAKSYTVLAVGQVLKDGQRDFDGIPNIQHVSDRDAALSAAKALLLPGRRILLRNIDTGEWSEISNRD
jgi:hypothetical protein